jgi:hypothetical protein
MNIRMLTDLSGARVHLAEGEVYDLPSAEAEILIAAGHAELVMGPMAMSTTEGARSYVRVDSKKKVGGVPLVTGGKQTSAAQVQPPKVQNGNQNRRGQPRRN